MEDLDAGIFYCSYKQTEQIYKFVYNATLNTLKIEIVEQLQLKPGEMAALAVNKNSNLTVWKNSGFKIKNGNNWCSTTAELFIVCDNEGRIVYSVYKPNTSKIKAR